MTATASCCHGCGCPPRAESSAIGYDHGYDRAMTCGAQGGGGVCLRRRETGALFSGCFLAHIEPVCFFIYSSVRFFVGCRGCVARCTHGLLSRVVAKSKIVKVTKRKYPALGSGSSLVSSLLCSLSTLRLHASHMNPAPLCPFVVFVLARLLSVSRRCLLPIFPCCSPRLR